MYGWLGSRRISLCTCVVGEIPGPRCREGGKIPGSICWEVELNIADHSSTGGEEKGDSKVYL